jgi:hypothetical protein
MPSFRERPLTWLFWLATACADLLGLLKYPEADWFATLMYGQLYIACAWAAISLVHRLVRAAAAIVAPLLVSLAVYYSQRVPSEAPAVLAAGLILGALVVIFTGILTLFYRALPGQPRDAAGKKFQFSITELLGWTILTALASWAITLAELPPLEHIWGLWSSLFSPVPPAVIVAGFLAPKRHFDRLSLLLSIATVIVFLAAANRWDNHGAEDLRNWAQLFGYVAFWVFVVRLDQAADSASSTAAVTSAARAELDINEQGSTS